MKSTARHRVKDWIRVYEDALDESFCAGVIGLFDRMPAKGAFDADWRRCVEYPAFDQTIYWQPFRDRIAGLLNRYRQESKSDGMNAVTQIESPNVFRYDAAPDKPNHFSRHADGWSADSATRQVSVIAYLNDVDEGGETEFSDQDLRVAPRRGSVLMFPSSFLFMHAGLPPISGPKYVIVTWLHFGGPTAYRSSPLFSPPDEDSR